jgi:LuxR family maltose regulon positive regulatory protein
MRPGIVDRTALVLRLAEAAAPVVTVVAPPGYGKTTLLAQWARHKTRLAWVTVDERDNDPAVLLTYLAVALDRIERIDPQLVRGPSPLSAGLADVASFVGAIAAMDAPVTIVLDQTDAVTNRACHDMIAELALFLPAGSQLAIAARHDVPLALSRLRAQNGILEVGAHDLEMDPQEAAQLLSGAGLELGDDEVEELRERTEGWAGGLYLAALAMQAGRGPDDASSTFAGDDRFIVDYLRSELLSRTTPDEMQFLTRTSILDRLTGPLCDVTLRGRGSAEMLERLEARNLMVVPLDHRREWYRYHHLFRDLLRTQLQRQEPALVPTMYRRAAAWCEENALPETAVAYAQQAGDADHVARIVLTEANPMWSSGRLDTVLSWMEWFSASGLVDAYPAVAVHGSLIYALTGRPGDADRWASAAERTPPTEVLADGNTMDATLAYLRALLCRDGLDHVRRDAQLALQGLSPTSPYRPAMLHAEGATHLLDGDLDTADRLFVRAVDEATSAGVLPFVPVMLAQRGVVAAERGDWAASAALGEQALAIMEHNPYDDYWTSALVFAFAARAASRSGDVERCRTLAGRAARLRPLLTYAIPILPVQALLELSRTYVVLGDAGGAGAALRQAQDILRQRPGLGNLPDQADALRRQLEDLRGGMIGASALTAAELRLLPLLPTHLSFPEIGERLFISRHTVKTQAISIYRKLGVSSRSEAIARMHELGLGGRS